MKVATSSTTQTGTASHHVPPTPATDRRSGPANQTVRILIVDDEAAMQALTCAIITEMGFDPIAVATGEEAIEAFREAKAQGPTISAVIMDLALPGGMSGLEATDRLREIDTTLPVIASSGYLQQNARPAAIERGFSGILPKPYTTERLMAELRWVLGQRGQSRN